MTIPLADLFTDWHPLDGTPAPEYVPTIWDGPHVGKRLIDALRTLALMPAWRGPQMFGNGWPEVEREFVDYAQFADDAQWKADRSAEFNHVRLKPTREDIGRMEIAIVWPARYLGDQPQLLRTVGMVAIFRARQRDISAAARKLRLRFDLVRRWNREGLDAIATGLIRDKVRIF